jgi:hypothetical protein
MTEQKPVKTEKPKKKLNIWLIAFVSLVIVLVVYLAFFLGN